MKPLEPRVLGNHDGLGLLPERIQLGGSPGGERFAIAITVRKHRSNVPPLPLYSASIAAIVYAGSIQARHSIGGQIPNVRGLQCGDKVLHSLQAILPGDVKKPVKRNAKLIHSRPATSRRRGERSD
jgi:hypothetical protein